MTPETAKLALQFLARCQLQGNEVPAFTLVVQELDAIVRPAPNGRQPDDPRMPPPVADSL
jgi:hypothetical protein